MGGVLHHLMGWKNRKINELLVEWTKCVGYIIIEFLMMLGVLGGGLRHPYMVGLGKVPRLMGQSLLLAADGLVTGN